MQFRITKSLLPDTSETSFRKLLQLIAAVVLISVLFSIFSFLALSTVETLPQQSELLLSIFAIASLCLVGLLFLIVRQIIRLFIEKKKTSWLSATSKASGPVWCDYRISLYNRCKLCCICC